MAGQISYSRKQAAEQTGVSVDTLDRAIKAGDLATLHPPIDGKPIASPLIEHGELIRWLRSRTA
jgi:hypothetical protein